MPSKTLLNFSAKIDSSIPGENLRCCFLRSDTNLVAYLGSLAALSNRSVVPHSAETTTTILLGCDLIIVDIMSRSDESLKQEPPNL